MMAHGVATLLISSAAGYWVLTSASSQKGRVKTLGQWLGLLIIAVSVVGAACKVYSLSNCKGKMISCPFTGATVPAPQK